MAWGVYARTCDELDLFTAACIGCSAPNTHGLALLEHPSTVANASYASWRCRSVERTFLMEQVLPYYPPGSSIPPAEDPHGNGYWTRTRALFQQMTLSIPNASYYRGSHCPPMPPHSPLLMCTLLTTMCALCVLQASYYLKLDCDTFLNMDSLRLRLLLQVDPGLRQPPDYIGKVMKGLFAFKGRSLTYMQGGAYALSLRAALVVASCTFDSWKWCPTTVFKLRNPAADSRMHQTCNDTNAIAEDLYIGACLQEASFFAALKYTA